MKKEIKIHQKSKPNHLFQATRMESSVKNFGNRQVRKPKQSKNS